MSFMKKYYFTSCVYLW